MSTKPEPSGGDAFDIIIVGAGAAGLSLAYHLAQSSLADRRILLLEPDRKDRDDRTWSFWSDSPTPFDALALQSWDCLLFVGPEARQALPLRSFRYRTIRGTDFYRFVLDALSTRPNVRLVRASVERVEDGEGGAQVFADGACYRGRWVFDSRFRRRDLAARAGGRHALLEQHFEGWEVETDHDAFDPAAATLFDFRTPPCDGPRFFYVLPFSPRLALVEHVLTRPAARPAVAEGPPSPTAAAALRSYLGGTLGLRDYRVVRREAGVSPLTDRPFPRRLGRSVMAIGVAGGRLKPSTGYAFTRIQADSAAIVRSLERHGEPFRVPPDRRRYRFLDAVLLRLMLRNGAAVAPVFAALFARNPPDRVLRFLDERASWREVLALVLSLPPWRFLVVLWLWGLARLADARLFRCLDRAPRAAAAEAAAADELTQERGRRHALGVDGDEVVEKLPQPVGRDVRRGRGGHLEQVALGEDLDDGRLVDERGVEGRVGEPAKGEDVGPLAAAHRGAARDVVGRRDGAPSPVAHDAAQEAHVREADARERVGGQ